MNCRRVLKRLALHAGRDLDPRATAAVDAHLRGCLSCYREFRGELRSLERVRVLRESVGPGPGDLVTSVMARLETEPAPRPRGLPGLRTGLSAGAWLAAAALVLAALFVHEEPPAPQPVLSPLGHPSQFSPDLIPRVPVGTSMNSPDVWTGDFTPAWEDLWSPQGMGGTQSRAPRVRTTPPLGGVEVIPPPANLRIF